MYATAGAVLGNATERNEPSHFVLNYRSEMEERGVSSAQVVKGSRISLS